MKKLKALGFLLLLLLSIFTIPIPVAITEPSAGSAEGLVGSSTAPPITFNDGPSFIRLNNGLFSIDFYKGTQGYNTIYDMNGEVLVYNERQALQYWTGNKWKQRGTPFELSWVQVNGWQYNVTRHYKDYLGTFYNVTFVIRSGEPIKSVISIDAGQTDEYKLSWELSGVTRDSVAERGNSLIFGEENQITFNWTDVYSTLGDITQTSVTESANGKKADISFSVGIIEAGSRVIIDPTVDTSTVPWSGAFAFQRKTFYSDGRFWVFYTDGVNAVYESSLDGVAWAGGGVSIGACVQGGFLSIWYNGTYVYYARYDSNDLFYRRGNPEANGTISWSAGEQTVYTGAGNDEYEYPNIAVDSTGRAWIGAYNDQPDGDDFPIVLNNTYTNGTWVTDTLYELSAIDVTTWRVNLVPLTGGRIYATYARNGQLPLGRLFDGVWGGEENNLADFVMQNAGYMSASAIGDDIHFIYLRSAVNNIYYNNRTFGVGWMGADVVVEAGVENDVGPTLSADPVTGDLYCFWTLSDDHVYYKQYTNLAGWDALATDWIDETVDDIQVDYTISAFYHVTNEFVGVLYSTRLANPYNVKFNHLVTTIFPPTILAVDGNTTFVTNEYGWINLTVREFEGFADLDNVTLKINTTGNAENFTLLWDQTSGLFTELDDPFNIVTIGASVRTNLNVTTDILSFNFTMTGGTTGFCDGLVVAFNDGGLNTTVLYVNLFTFSFINWDPIGDALNSAFSFWGIPNFMAQASSYINGLAGYFTSSMINLVDLVAQQMRLILAFFASYLKVFTGAIDAVLTLWDNFYSLIAGTNPIIDLGIGNFWDFIAFGTWQVAFYTFGVIFWIDGLAKRAKFRGQGEVAIILSDVNQIINLTSYFLQTFAFLLNEVANWALKLFDAITGVIPV